MRAAGLYFTLTLRYSEISKIAVLQIGRLGETLKDLQLAGKVWHPPSYAEMYTDTNMLPVQLGCTKHFKNKVITHL